MAQKIIYLAGGCFWGLEELFREQPGVIDTEVGYAGGTNDKPDYQNHPGHAETLAITYDSQQTTYTALLDFFFRVHNPTTLNRQGNDTGSSQAMIEIVNKSGLYKDPVVTSLEPYTKFYSAESYHQDYLQKNPGGYTCHYVRSEHSLT
jgi:peptide-methionine (S)-S-oxide reductase